METVFMAEAAEAKRMAKAVMVAITEEVMVVITVLTAVAVAADIFVEKMGVKLAVTVETELSC
ncbi:hypothetical protein [Bartonella heixiaziensis]|uniref:hypothetical protein n=1 Tax=Bartonella heixiaziensis TaxID=1461000 RepID=UPI003D23C100